MHMAPQLHSPQRYGNVSRICRSNYFAANRYRDRPQFSLQVDVMPCPAKAGAREMRLCSAAGQGGVTRDPSRQNTHGAIDPTEFVCRSFLSSPTFSIRRIPIKRLGSSNQFVRRLRCPFGLSSAALRGMATSGDWTTPVICAFSTLPRFY